jgi:hypothetical protein
MEPCIQSANITGACLMCGGRAEKMHQPMFHRGIFCPRCCVVCAPKTASAATVATASNMALATQSPARLAAQGATQWKDDGWGPRADDPFYHDRQAAPATLPMGAAPTALVSLEELNGQFQT